MINQTFLGATPSCIKNNIFSKRQKTSICFSGSDDAVEYDWSGTLNTQMTIDSGLRTSAGWTTSPTKIKIGTQITKIDRGVFQNCTTLQSVVIPNTVSALNEGCFYGSNITSIVIPGSVQATGNMICKKCYDLEKAVFLRGCSVVPNAIFDTCSSLVDVDLPNSITSIDRAAFYNCTALKSMTLPDSLQTIGEMAFQSCESLSSVVVPDSVVDLGSSAFCRCTNLEIVKLSKNITTIKDNMFHFCHRLQNIEIHDGVTTIENDAFNECHQLKSINIPDTVVMIEAAAFRDCSNCDIFNFGNTRTTIPTLSDTSVFNLTSSTKKIVVPDALYDAWRTTDVWSSSTNNIQSSIVRYSEFYS